MEFLECKVNVVNDGDAKQMGFAMIQCSDDGADAYTS